MNDVFLSLGSNINKEDNLPTAVALLADLCEVVAIAPVYETIPVGLREQPNFFNTAVRLKTPLSAEQVKIDIIGAVEKALKRVRVTDKNAPRTIDVDIALFNEDVFEYAGSDGRYRHIPDPDILKFSHVAMPLADLAPEMAHPETGEQLAEIAERLQATAVGTIWVRDDIQLKI